MINLENLETNTNGKAISKWENVIL